MPKETRPKAIVKEFVRPAAAKHKQPGQSPAQVSQRRERRQQHVAPATPALHVQCGSHATVEHRACVWQVIARTFAAHHSLPGCARRRPWRPAARAAPAARDTRRTRCTRTARLVDYRRAPRARLTGSSTRPCRPPRRRPGRPRQAPQRRSASTPRPSCTAATRPPTARACSLRVPGGRLCPPAAPAGHPCPRLARSTWCCRCCCSSSLSWCAQFGWSCTRAATNARDGRITRTGCMPGACTCPEETVGRTPSGIGLLAAPLAGQQQ